VSPPPERVTAKGPRLPSALGQARRYRFVYEKLGPAAFLSHLDLIRALPRAFRRLELPLYYSGGFHPKPEMTFGPALSLGVHSLCEVVDVKITADIEPGELLAQLSEGSHEGLRFLGGVRLGPNDAAVSRVIDTASYAVGIPRAAMKEGEDALRERMARALEAGELPVTRVIEGIRKRVDVKEFLRGAHFGQGEQAVAAAGFVGDFVHIAVQVEVRGSGGVKVAEVVEALFGDPELPYRAVRTELGTKLPDGRVASPIELDALRERRAERERPAAMPPTAPEEVLS
jgi:radical SAM-linked protein